MTSKNGPYRPLYRTTCTAFLRPPVCRLPPSSSLLTSIDPAAEVNFATRKGMKLFVKQLSVPCRDKCSRRNGEGIHQGSFTERIARIPTDREIRRYVHWQNSQPFYRARAEHKLLSSWKYLKMELAGFGDCKRTNSIAMHCYPKSMKLLEEPSSQGRKTVSSFVNAANFPVIANHQYTESNLHNSL